MATEIERKFRVAGNAWRDAADAGTRYVQGYLASGASGATVRVRLAGATGWLTIKGPTVGLSRPEFEYEIPAADTVEMLQTLCTAPPIDKTRYTVTVGQHLWEIDVFAGVNAGLVVAEVELGSEAEPFERPSWLGAEVSDDPRFFNAALAKHPYQSWAAS